MHIYKYDSCVYVPAVYDNAEFDVCSFFLWYSLFMFDFAYGIFKNMFDIHFTYFIHTAKNSVQIYKNKKTM